MFETQLALPQAPLGRCATNGRHDSASDVMALSEQHLFTSEEDIEVLISDEEGANPWLFSHQTHFINISFHTIIRHLCSAMWMAIIYKNLHLVQVSS